MLKFVKHHMETILGIELYPMISLLIFFLFFSAVLYLVFSMSKSHVEKMGNIPMEDNEEGMA